MPRFSSSKHTTRTADPAPWLAYDGTRTAEKVWTQQADDQTLWAPSVFAPRRKFEVPLNDPANEVIGGFRVFREDVAAAHPHLDPVEVLAGAAAEFLFYSDEPDYTGDPVELEHAKSVLRRIISAKEAGVFA